MEYLHVVPATQVPLPVQPCPAHCEYFGSVPPAAATEVELVTLELVLLVVTGVVMLVVVFTDTVAELVLFTEVVTVLSVELLALDTTEPPGPETPVVMDPLST